MDATDQALLQIMSVGSVVADLANKDRLDRLVEAGLAQLVKRDPPFRNYPVPAPVYQITALGQATLDASLASGN